MTAVQISPQTRALLLTCRSALIMILRALEDYLGLPYSKEPSTRRRSSSQTEVWRLDNDSET